ncbi:MAG TPA: hypothetical protein VKX41_15955 [Alloacidobacterium sp.]|nr:hypothetical protein [Alloacidobacterium sp.]
MRVPRNPFRLRAAEAIENDVTFLKLFGPEMLDLLGDDPHLWDKPQLIRSAPGAGKTTLLRLFTPAALVNLHAFKANDDLKELYQRMDALGVINDGGPQILGVFLSCARNYRILDDLDFEAPRKQRLLFGLLNARIVLAALRASLQLRGLRFPEDLARIKISADAPIEIRAGEPGAISGIELQRWATDLEENVCDAIDSFDGGDLASLPGSDTLHSITLMRPGVLTVDGEAVASHCLLLLDDVHHLTHGQRTLLLKTVADMRAGVGVWLAERFEALSTDEMLETGVTEGRDYEGEILIERFWRESANKFANLLNSVADRRASAALTVEVTSLDSCLQASLDGTEWQAKYEATIPVIRDRVTQLARGSALFHDWIEMQVQQPGGSRDRAIGWRVLEILMHRELRNKQTSFDFPLSPAELKEKTDSSIRAAAELFLAHEFHLPYYFGPKKLANLASWNIEQFMRLAGDEFEEVVASSLISKTPTLNAGRQDSLLREASESFWLEIPRRARYGEKVHQLLTSIGRFCRQRTYEENAPYDPGVTGIAISMKEREQLQSKEFLAKNPEYVLLADVLAAAIANNLLEAQLDRKVKGDTWMVLNLNRLLCVSYDLPLQYGGFKERPLRDLYMWMTAGYEAKKSLL